MGQRQPKHKQNLGLRVSELAVVVERVEELVSTLPIFGDGENENLWIKRTVDICADSIDNNLDAGNLFVHPKMLGNTANANLTKFQGPKNVRVEPPKLYYSVLPKKKGRNQLR